MDQKEEGQNPPPGMSPEGDSFPGGGPTDIHVNQCPQRFLKIVYLQGRARERGKDITLPPSIYSSNSYNSLCWSMETSRLEFCRRTLSAAYPDVLAGTELGAEKLELE